MNKFIIIFGLSLFSLNANAIYLETCVNHSLPNQAVSNSYQSCTNRNFNTLAREMTRRGENVLLENCTNTGDLVQFSYTSCINNNFSSISRVVRLPIYLMMCTIFDPTRLGYSFNICVRSNNRTLERTLRY
ncbi:MAG: hypothetical protein HN576_11200 [Bacteriovoracaceae bacterium]|jgi:hypothetical protein|nr:hypothetical protein [Bacteriovoracaceae bacterium]